MNILNTNSLNEIEKWLNVHLNGLPIIPSIENLNHFPKKKGIYFWFMHPDGYQILRRYITLNKIEGCFKKEIEGTLYDLVYIGTAGTGKAGGGNLSQRLSWHINNRHSTTSVCSGALSTFRAGIGALLSEDLILPNTEVLVNDFMRNYLIVDFIAYDDFQIDSINNHEKSLIENLRPLFNIKNNPNSAPNAIENGTKSFRRRRSFVYHKTRKRLGCPNDSDQIRSDNLSLPPSIEDPLIDFPFADSSDCIEFILYQYQSIHELIQRILDLPQGNCTIVLSSVIQIENPVYINGNVRRTGRIYAYFYAPDTNQGSLPRWRIIQNEMRNLNLDEIAVRICKKDNSKKKILTI